MVPPAPSAFSNTAKQSQVTTVTLAMDLAKARKDDYDAAADMIALGAQAYDIPLIGAGIAGVNAAAFGGREKLAKRAAVFATGVLATRSYYDPKKKHEIMLDAASALTCVRRTAFKLTAVDGQIAQWKAAQVALGAGGGGEIADTIRRLAPIAIYAHLELSSAVTDVDTAARKRLFSGDAPNLSGFAQIYRSQVIKLNEETTQNGVAANAARNTPAVARAGEDYKHLVADPNLNNALTSLSTDLLACQSIIGGT
ncbi:hypothetical protein [Caulobacter sp. AP07]|uniref:hypothetical protein n=1 Tax=Caulobacter sp. AP07 TaxID=1144304 RepID=UPI00054CFA85|nr:hypothetical protein [Caulobacter sp. AP07]